MSCTTIGNSTSSMRKRINTPPPKKSSKKTLAPVPNKIPRTLLFVRHSDKLMLFFSIGLVLVRKYNYRGRVKVTQDSQRPSKEILRFSLENFCYH